MNSPTLYLAAILIVSLVAGTLAHELVFVIVGAAGLLITTIYRMLKLIDEDD